MRSNYINASKARKIAREAAAEETAKMYDEAYRNAIKDIIPQNMAVHLYVLEKAFGFGKKRLQRFFDEVNSVNDMMMKGNVYCGKGFDTDDVKKYIGDKYGINLTLEEVVVKNRRK